MRTPRFKPETTFFIRRFDMNGTIYGEIIHRNTTRKGCLKYLKECFELNKNWIVKIEREQTTFTVHKANNIFHYAILKPETEVQ